VSKSDDMSPEQWAHYIEEMADVPPTTEVSARARALLAIAFCEPEWMPADCRRDAPHAVWERLTVPQWQGLVRWSQLRRRRGEH
jgi:hypothetical protein